MQNKTQKAALEYSQCGWSIFPMNPQSKRPAVPWKRFQAERATEAQIEKWFSHDKYGIGVILGEVSGNLICRDFDDLETYKQWAKKQRELAQTLPTVETARGRHVYATASAEHVQDIRRLIGKPDGIGAIVAAGGELRCGVGCYNVLPPSIHESGHVYRWLVPLPKDSLPELDLIAAGFLCFTQCDREHREYGDHRGSQRVTEAIDGRGNNKQQKPTPKKGIRANLTKTDTHKKATDPHAWGEAIQWAIVDSVPEGPGKRHRQVFELARSLKAVPELVDAGIDELKPIVKQWHKLSLDKITTKPFTETWIDFIKAWPSVEYPKGADPMTVIFEKACTSELPEVASEYDQQGQRLLVALCRELQRSAGDGAFFLSCRTAGKLLEVNHSTANRWLFLLVHDGLLEVVHPGDRSKRQAARYRYLGGMEQ